MAISPLLLIGVSLLAGVAESFLCNVGEIECSSHCCTVGEQCMKLHNGTRICGIKCTGKYFSDVACYRHQSKCCSDMPLTYCCPSGSICNKGRCDSPMFNFTVPDFKPHPIPNLDLPSYNTFDESQEDDYTSSTSDSSSGSNVHFIVGGGVIFLVIPLCFVVRRRRYLLWRRSEPVPAGGTARSLVITRRNNRPDVAARGAVMGQTNVPATQSGVVLQPPPYSKVGVRPNQANQTGVGTSQSALPVELPPYSEFVDVGDKNRLHDAKHVEQV